MHEADRRGVGAILYDKLVHLQVYIFCGHADLGKVLDHLGALARQPPRPSQLLNRLSVVHRGHPLWISFTFVDAENRVFRCYVIWPHDVLRHRVRSKHFVLPFYDRRFGE